MHTMLISLALAALLCNPALALFPGWFSNNLIPRDAANDTVAECSREKACAFNICCGKSGKCGTTTEFCGLQEGCLRDCDQPHDPHCEATNRADGRTIGYYESWARYRTCQSVTLETLNVTGYTHINYGFVYFDPKTFAIAPTDDGEPPMYANFTNLKVDHPGLQTWVAIGGWSFNDPGPTANAFSDMVATKESRGAFITAITGFMHTYAFDGVDIDWEYPVDADRGGKPEDKENFVAFAKEVHDALQTAGYGFSITLPASYKHLKNIDVTGMNDNVDFFNIMAYDMHGVYDDAPGGVGPYVLPHTNLTEIEAFLDILLKAKVDSGKVNLGLAFYGHTFTLKDPKCDQPDGVCQFDGDGKGVGKGAGKKGNCTATEGMLNLEEILDIVAKEKCSPVIDDKAAIKYVTSDDNQWIGYDDEETLGIKRAAANRRCLGGTMVWAMDTIDQKSPSMLPPAALDQTRRLPSAANGTVASDCDMFKLPEKGTCKNIATPEKNFTCSQLMAWNPQISLQDWNNLKTDSEICISPPGGWYVLAPPPPKASADGGAASSTAAASGTAPAGPVQCTTSAAVPSGDGCDKFASSYGIVASQLYAWNPSLDTSCKNLEAGKSYCVGAGSGSGAPTGPAGSGYNATSPSSTAAVNGSAVASASDSMITSPTPSESAVGSDSAPATTAATITGDASGSASAPPCTSSAVVAKGDGCDKFASANGIAPSQLYAWNPSLDTSCKNLEAGKSYCVGAGSGGGVSATAASNASSSAAVKRSSVAGSSVTSWTGYDIGPVRGGGASSTQSGWPSNCNSFAAPGPTDNCEIFASAQHIELKRLFDWNAVLDAACKNIVAGVDYCVGTATVGLLSTPSPDAATTAAAAAGDSASSSVGISSRGIATASYAPLSNAPVASTGFPDDAPSGNASPSGEPPIYANSSATSTVAAPSSYAASSTTDVPSSDASPNAAPSSAPSDTAAPPASGDAEPTAVQAGIDPSCTKFIEVSKGDTCLEFAARNGIKPEQLYAMNPILGANGENCPQKFWAGTSYCVAA